MDSSCDIEQFVNKFVASKTGEKIYLDLCTEHVIQLKPVCKKGSISLGIFWVHVFQHPNNYPIYSYHYKKLYRAGTEYELQLRIDGISLSINLQTGLLTLRGTFIIDWFVCQFSRILEAYTLSPGAQTKEARKMFTKEEMETLQKERRENYKKYIEKWPEFVLKLDANIMEAGKQATNAEAIDKEGFLLGQDLETYCPIPDLLDENETKQQLVRLENGQVIQGHVLYRLWLSTLNSWFSDKDGKVYIFTPHIDCNSLVDLCKLFLKNRNTACIATICIPMSNLYGRFATVKREAIKHFSEKVQVMIEYKVYSQIQYPVTEFNTSFIAMIKNGIAHILLTNTNFDRASFFTMTSTTVHYKELDEKQFVSCYQDPILE